MAAAHVVVNSRRSTWLVTLLSIVTFTPRLCTRCRNRGKYCISYLPDERTMKIHLTHT